MKQFFSALIALAAVVGILFLVSAGVGGEEAAHGAEVGTGAVSVVAEH